MYLLSQESQNSKIKTWLSHFITYQTWPKADTTLQRQGYSAQDARHTCTAHAVQDSNSYRVLILFPSVGLPNLASHPMPRRPISHAV
jgi:putative IMPACT (imprinted ancient) family translation regulator